MFKSFVRQHAGEVEVTHAVKLRLAPNDCFKSIQQSFALPWVKPARVVAETASKKDERKTFKELIGYVKNNVQNLDGVLFFKVDRAARNLFDYIELERLGNEHGVPVVYVSQPTENAPAGRMMHRTLANMAAFYAEQQSLNVREGHARRVQSGLFVSTGLAANRPLGSYQADAAVHIIPQQDHAACRLISPARTGQHWR